MATEDYTEKGLVKYTSRDYTSIMEDFWSIVPKMTELWRPEADADPGVVLGKFLASVADMLGVNLDSLATEVFAPSVRQRKDAEKLFALIGYELGWYTAARTEVTFTNNTDTPLTFDFGFNGSNFATLNAYTDITNQSRVITYNIMPLTNTYGASDSRSTRSVVSPNINVFADTDEVTLQAGESVTRVAIEGEFRYYSVSVEAIRKNNYIINIPSQHIDTTAIWVKAKASKDADDFLATQWIQVSSPSEFIIPEPRFAVTYDSYSNAQIQISNYLDQMEAYDSSSYLMIYWLDCSGVIGCVGQDVLSNYLQAKPSSLPDEASNEWSVSNLSNTVELPNTYTVTGKSPETAKEAYLNSRNYINTWDSLITLPDFNRFLNREAGVDCGIVLDCQKALDTNLAIYQDTNLTNTEKRKMYITNYDFPQGESDFDWISKVDTDAFVTQTTHRVVAGQTLDEIALMYNVPLADLLAYNNLTEDSVVYPGYLLKIPVSKNTVPSAEFITNFKTYTAMCYAIHNDFAEITNWGRSQTSTATFSNNQVFIKYRPPAQFIEAVKRDFRPLQAMSVELEFGDVRVFNFYIAGQIYTKKPVSNDVARTIIAQVKENLALYFSPANRQMGQKPTTMEIVKVVQNSDTRIDYFDAGSTTNPVIVWSNCDPQYFNIISFARLIDPGSTATNLTIAPECIVSNRR
ncbi:MAG: LysM peptidoglycan-binding domain-containing protein [Bacteroidaceae bacterium]|nr:LysM peptidoglycan-binding domain-containing protein [Bacteroidaceae bacterium]